MSLARAYGAWPSPISADSVARGEAAPSFPRFGPDGTLWWTESRPSEGGRVALVHEGRSVLPAPWSVRSTVHEYGGRAMEPVDGGAVFSSFEDQRLWLLREGSGDPVPLTPEPASPGGLRYVEPISVGDAVWCVRERHGADAGPPERHLVAVPLDGSGDVTELVGGSDFLASPRLSPDGRHLAWVAWDHPRMPWDGSEVRVAQVDALADWRSVRGGPTEAASYPEWGPDGTLYAVTDRSGWWNLERIPLDGGAPEALHPADEEYAVPLWMPGFRPFVALPDGRLACLHDRGTGRLGLLDPATGDLTDLDLPWTVIRPVVALTGTVIATVAASPTAAPAVVTVDVATGRTAVRSSTGAPPDPAFLPVPQREVFRGLDDREVHAVVYPPRHPEVEAPDGELPPYVVFVHGGPTSQVHAELDLEKAYFTSRGIGVVDVDYGGSSGYGRAYRERLREQWGVVDVEDCIAAVRGLAERGEADAARLVIRGGSAGGWTTLAALTGTDVFAAGTSYYGVAELLRFAEDTHDFESRYLDGLIGPLPETRDRYVERAPLSHVDGLACPVLLLQGLDDKVVPPSQAELFVAALKRKGIPHAYLTFAGEAHGFRRAETVVACLEAELSFYGSVLGFEPPDVPVLPLSP